MQLLKFRLEAKKSKLEQQQILISGLALSALMKGNNLAVDTLASFRKRENFTMVKIPLGKNQS